MKSTRTERDITARVMRGTVPDPGGPERVATIDGLGACWVEAEPERIVAADEEVSRRLDDVLIAAPKCARCGYPVLRAQREAGPGRRRCDDHSRDEVVCVGCCDPDDPEET